MVDTTSGDEAAGLPVRSPPREGAYGTAGKTSSEEGGRGSGSGSGKGDTAEITVAHPAKVGEGKTGVFGTENFAIGTAKKLMGLTCNFL